MIIHIQVNFKYNNNQKWKCSEVVFSDKEDSKRCAYILNYKGHIIMLPLIGGGNYVRYSAYLPFPTMAGKIEAPPETHLPFLTPELILKNGEIVMPVSFIECAEMNSLNEEVIITYRGKLCKTNNISPLKSEYGFNVKCRFYENKINVNFNIEADILESKMVYAGDAKIIAFGFNDEVHFDTEDNPDYFTPHGPLNKAVLFKGTKNTFGYEIELD